MHIVTLIVIILGLFGPSVAIAQSTTGYIAIPASGFTPRNSTTVEGPLRGTVETLGHTGNATGTARFFGDNSVMFAPVNLPHGSTVVSLACAGKAPTKRVRIFFSLRRNEPQQANVDMAGVGTKWDDTSFEFISTSRISSPVIDNQKFNYYIVAGLNSTNDIDECRTCLVNKCTIGYVFRSVGDIPTTAVE